MNLPSEIARISQVSKGSPLKKQTVKLPQGWGNIAKVTYSLLGKLVIFT